MMMDNIDLFVDHFVIYSESREALILNGNKEQFESRLRELVLMEIKDTLMERVRHYERQREKFPNAGLKRYDRLTDARDALKDLHDDLEFWGEEYHDYQDRMREQA
jgi:DNA-binding HxlR family transcriptional regulator